MNCVSPIVLKNGNVVPCGKCALCLSAKRTDWSVRLQLHTWSYDQMPLFVTLTYDPAHVPFGSYKPTLCRSDVRKFIKMYKDRYHLHDRKFTYFGCGEYGDRFDRPHYHIIIFGDIRLYELYQQSEEKARNRLYDVWKKGLVHICVADWSGIHYVTKYVLKENPEDWSDAGIERPFTIASQGLGLGFMESREVSFIRYQVSEFLKRKDEISYVLNSVRLSDDIGSNIISVRDALRKVEKFVPDFKVILPSGKVAFLPRELRRRIVGSFEHFKDNPFWLVNHFRLLLDSLVYYRDNMKYDRVSDLPISMQKSIQRIEVINRRIIEKKYLKSFLV